MANETIINKNFNGEYQVIINHTVGNTIEVNYPVVEDGVKWETDRQGSPSKLTFKVYKEKNSELNFQEGDSVVFNYRNDGGNWITLFVGYVFKKQRKKDGWIDVTAYDALRYLKNKGTYVFTNKTASDVLKMICNDYKLPIGTVESTNYVIGSRVEDNQTLFDIIQNALDLTLISSNKMYVLFTENGKVCLKDANNLKTNVVINDVTAEDFDYTSSIDDEVYNEIELYYDNDQTNKREYYHAIDSNNVGTWGRLRYTESVQNPANAQDRAKKMLKLYNRKNRKLQVNKAFGDCQCRAGASVIVNLDLGDIKVSNYMLIEKATHIFKKDEYRMDLTLSNAEFSV